ncbi:MaoC family dehydratase N-terminal domain-containing protein [Arthrobacter sp. UCD-GKA]|uniref:FAS1-like dehydratase domain-containing protein n=1 Tax=Arthrobacter sp. UCD-GKA TaxID=1913576 RepID=UPI0015878A42|nr:MaoC family dehydratase N-terminal domain-containing protein [Arthrobacter sp. UCD-GKA]
MGTLIGTIVDEITFTVERGKVAEFARATYTQDPVHTDQNAAAEAGFASEPATGTHVVVAGHHRDQRAVVAHLGLELSRIVVGSVKWEYERPLLVGDNLTGIRIIIGDETKEGKRGGSMRVITLETKFRDKNGLMVSRQQETLIERGQS